MIEVKRTGKVWSIASSEYLATMPDGTVIHFWSPPWNQYTPEEEDEHALEYAEERWEVIQRARIGAEIEHLLELNSGFSVWELVDRITREHPQFTEKQVADVYYEMHDVLEKHRTEFSE